MNRYDLTNVRSGKLVAKEHAYTDQHRRAVWRCECDCGKTCYVAATYIRSQSVKSCGCLKLGKCAICGAPIEQYKKYCSAECRRIGHINRTKKSQANAAQKRKKKKLSPLDAILAELAEYNRKNGTNLSYGYYVHLKEVVGGLHYDEK